MEVLQSERKPLTTTQPVDSRGAARSTQESPQACLSMASVQPTPDQDPVSRSTLDVPRPWLLSTRKTPRKADSGVAVQYHSKTASACETAVLQLKGSGRRTYLQQTWSALLLFAVIVPQGRELGRHSNVAVMQSPTTGNETRRLAPITGSGLAAGKGGSPSNP